jgi:arylsulfatase A-like enzyme/Tfp pilus assembly protein PilF
VRSETKPEQRRGRGIALGAIALAAVLAVPIAAWLARRGTPRVAEGGSAAGVLPRGRHDVFLITVDTLRADRLPAYGYGGIAAPAFDGLAREAVRFTSAATAVPFTLPAHSSIMTGAYPPRHGVRENVGYSLDPALPTLAEVLGGAGWATGGFVSAFVLDGRWGIGRGFATYFDDFDLRGMERADLGSVQRDGAETIAAAVDWLDGKGAGPAPRRPVFLWLHLFEPHDPYTPPEPYRSRYPGRPYDGEVAYADALVGRFRAALAERGLWNDSLTIVTGDHGEGLGDHGEAFHGFFVYDSTVRVPLFVRLPGGAGGGRVVDAAVSHVDLLPTVLDLVGVAPPAGVHGRSLAPLLAGDGGSGGAADGGGSDPTGSGRGGDGDGGGERGRGGERDGAGEPVVYSESLYPLLHYGWAPLRAVRAGGLKLIAAPRPELYDLAADPGEVRDLTAARRPEARALLRRLAALREEIERGAPAPAAEPAALDEEALEQLRALGYVAGRGGVDLAAEDDAERADPKDKIALHRLIMAAQSAIGGGDEAAAAARLAEVLAQDPGIVDAHQMLGNVAARAGRHEEAIGHFSAALALDPEHRAALFGMAAAYRGQGREEEALVGFRRLLALNPRDAKAALATAELLVAAGARGEALAALEAAAAGGSPPAVLLNQLGELLVLEGRAGAARARFAAAIAANPEFALPRFNLAVLDEEAGDLPAAAAGYRRAIELAPRYHQAQFNLGRLAARTGDRETAEKQLAAAIASDPDLVQAYHHLGKLLMDRGDLARAEELVRAGLARDPDGRAGPLGWYVLADLLNRTDRPAAAAEAARRGRALETAAHGVAGADLAHRASPSPGPP